MITKVTNGARRTNVPYFATRLSRIVGGSLEYLAEMFGATMFIFGYQFGLYIAAIAMVTNTCYMITAAWLLIIGVFDQRDDSA